MVAVEILKEAVVQMMQIVVVEVGVYFLANGLTTPPTQGSLSPDPACTAPYSYYQAIAELQNFQASAIMFAAWMLCALKIYLDTLGPIAADLPKWKKYAIRSVLILAIAASAVASALAAMIFYNVMLVKVGLDKQGCLPGALKPVLVAVYVVLGAVGLLVHGFVASVAFK